MKKHFMIPGADEVVVVTKELKRRCFHENRFGEDRKDDGWCATCRKEAEAGEYGYCGEHSLNRTVEQTLNFTSNWGFCLRSSACTRSSLS